MRYLLCLLVTLGLFSCKSTKNIEPDSFEGRQIRFGSGGGITGALTQWALLDNGRLWGVSGEPTANLKHVAKVSKKEVTAIFSSLDSLNWGEPVNQPGNMYRFLELHDGKEVTRIVWDPFQQENFPRLNSFFEKLKPIMKAYGPAPPASDKKEDPGHK